MSAKPEPALLGRIERLHSAYVHAIDDDRLEKWPDFFVDDGLYRICTRENLELDMPLGIMHCAGIGMLRDRISALRTANIYEPHTYRHMIAAAEITDSGADGHSVRSNFTVIRTMHSGGMSVFACGTYLDLIIETEHGLKFAERLAVCDSRSIDTLLVIPL